MTRFVLFLGRSVAVAMLAEKLYWDFKLHKSKSNHRRPPWCSDWCGARDEKRQKTIKIPFQMF